MLPYEYSVILKALKGLGIHNISVYFEASSVADMSLNGKVHRIGTYFNKRFFKFTESGRDYHPEVGKQISYEECKEAKSLFVSEGNLLPSKTEIGLAKKAKFDLYTITNLSFMDLAEYLTMKPLLYAVTKTDLGNTDEVVSEFSSSAAHFQTQVQTELAPEEALIKSRPVALDYAATFDVMVRLLFLTFSFSTLVTAYMTPVSKSKKSSVQWITLWSLKGNRSKCSLMSKQAPHSR